MSIPPSSTQIPNPEHHHRRRRSTSRSGTNQNLRRHEKNLPFPPDRPCATGEPIDFIRFPQNFLSPTVFPHTHRKQNPQEVQISGRKIKGQPRASKSQGIKRDTVRSSYSDLSDGLVHPVLAGRSAGNTSGTRVGARSGGEVSGLGSWLQKGAEEASPPVFIDAL